MNKPRYIVESRDLDGIMGYYVLDTHHELFKIHSSTLLSSAYIEGFSGSKKEMTELAEKLNNS